MKLNFTTRKNNLIWSSIILIFGIISGLAVWQLTNREETVNEPENIPKEAWKKPEKVQKQAQIKLPGAKPVDRLPGDYEADDHIWRLVNKSHQLNDINYRPADLRLATVASRPDKSRDERSVREIIMPEAEKLFTAAKQAGHDLQIGSGFRSHDLQKMYYDNYSRSYGQAEADKFSAKPGYSEHQTGLVMDLATTDHQCYLEECFGDTAAGKWLADHAHEYGFILRYPRGKNNITDFIYEPWHFRYVGKELAAALKQSGLTLDEATPYLLRARDE